MRLQNENKQREGKYRNIQMARIKQKKENDENEKEYKKKLQEVNERLLEMQEIEVDLIRYGGGVKKLDPV